MAHRSKTKSSQSSKGSRNEYPSSSHSTQSGSSESNHRQVDNDKQSKHGSAEPKRASLTSSTDLQWYARQHSTGQQSEHENLIKRMSPTSSTYASYGSSSNAYPTDGMPASDRDRTSNNYTPIQRWADQTPGAEPWNSISYHARNPGNAQPVQFNPAATHHPTSSYYNAMHRWQSEGPRHEPWNSLGYYARARD